MTSPVKIWRRQKVIRNRLGRVGKILAWTIIRVPGPDHKQFAPYPVVLVEFDTKERVYGQLVDCQVSELKINKKVSCILRRVREPSDDGVIAYGLKFKPV